MTRRRVRRPGPVTMALAALAGAAVAIAIVVVGKPSSKATASTRTATVEKGVIQSTVSGTGNLDPANEMDLSFGTSGQVTHVYVHAGEHVHADQLLAQLDSSEAHVTLAQAEADLQSAEDTLANVGSSNSSSSSSTAATASAASVNEPVAEAATTPTTPTTPTTTTTTPATTTPTTTTTTPTTTTPSGNGKSGSGGTDSGQSGSGQSSNGGGNGQSSDGGGSGNSSGSSATSLASAQAAVDSAKLSVESAEKALAATKLRAPAPGTVAAVNGATGDTVGTGSSSSSSSGNGSSGSDDSGNDSSSGNGSDNGNSSSSSSGFIQLVQVSNFKLDLSLSESDIGKVKIGQPATVTVNAADGEEFAAHVTDIGVLPASSGSSGAVSYPVTLTFDQVGRKLKAGMSASADIVTSQVSGLAVPNQALTGSTVTVVKNGRQSTQTVQTGVVGDSTTQIVSGLHSGDEVVVRSTSAAAGANATGATTANGLNKLGGSGGLGRLGGGGGAFPAGGGNLKLGGG